MAFLLCDPYWYVHKPDVQNKWDDNTHTHREQKTAEVRDVRKTGGGRGLRGGEGKIVDGVFPGRPQSFRYQRRPVDDCSPGR